MSEYFKMFIEGTSIMTNVDSIKIKRKKNLIVKNELRIAKAKMGKSVLQRSSDRIRNIKMEALS
jgi:hypothetical protein